MINWCKNKTHINLIIDAIMFLVLMAISGLGLLMKYVLIPGYKRVGLHENDVDYYFFGLSRHEWGDIHLWLAFLFLFLLVLHVILHWNMIICIFRQMISGKSLRISIASLIGVAGLFLLLSPLFLQPEAGPSTRQYRHRSASPGYPDERFNRGQFYQQRTDRELLKPENIYYERLNRGQYYRQKTKQELLTPKTIRQERSTKIQESPSEIIRIYTYMTLNEVSEKYNISAHKLAEELNIPVTETDEKLIDLRKKYNFLLPDVRKAVRKLQ